jgi:hypothetical protein
MSLFSAVKSLQFTPSPVSVSAKCASFNERDDHHTPALTKRLELRARRWLLVVRPKHGGRLNAMLQVRELLKGKRRCRARGAEVVLHFPALTLVGTR